MVHISSKRFFVRAKHVTIKEANIWQTYWIDISMSKRNNITIWLNYEAA